MLEERDHRMYVREWLMRASEGAPSDRLCRRFEHLFLRLWQRAGRTLGEVTLGAIVDRVLINATEQYPLLDCIELDDSGPRFDALHARAASLQTEELAAALSTLLVEFVTVLGTLTAGVLTPALRAELATPVPDDLSATTHPSDGPTS